MKFLNPRFFKIVTLNWEHVDLPYTIAIWLLLASVAKICMIFVYLFQFLN
jgi:hypothetical protein